eukprot:1190948-Rhodomonas_salina.2
MLPEPIQVMNMDNVGPGMMTMRGMENMSGRWKEGWKYTLWGACMTCPVLECCWPWEVWGRLTRDYFVYETMKNNRSYTKEMAMSFYDGSSAEMKQGVWERHRGVPKSYTQEGRPVQPSLVDQSTESLKLFMVDGEDTSTLESMQECAENCCAWGCTMKRNSMQIKHMVETLDNERKGGWLQRRERAWRDGGADID